MVFTYIFFQKDLSILSLKEDGFRSNADIGLNPPFIPVSWVDDENILQDHIQLTLPTQPAYSISLIMHRFFFFNIWRKSGPANYKKYMWFKKKEESLTSVPRS